MPRAIALSRAARTLLSRHLSGERAEETSDDLRAYRELAAAGLMTPTDGESSFHLTEEGRARCREFVPQAGELSEVSVALLRGRLNGDEEVNDANRAAYRELAMAGVMIPLHTFSGGDESAYRFTEEGWERRFEFIGPSPGGFLARLRRRAAAFLVPLSALLRVIRFRARPARAR